MQNLFKPVMLILLFAVTLTAQDYAPDSDSYFARLPHQEAKRVILQSFDTIIDMYRTSDLDEKLNFIAHLDDFEIELFMEYLREKYPQEFDQIH